MDTFEAAHDAHAQKIFESGIDTPASRCYRDCNYAIIQVIPPFLCSFIEMFRKSREDLKRENMFTKVYGKIVEHDDTRTLINCEHSWVMWVLISSMVTINMAKHGFLMVVCSSMCRVARVVTYIESKGGVLSSIQAWHEDFNSCMAGVFGHDFGLSVLVSCFGDSEVDIVRMTYGQAISDQFLKDNLVQVKLGPGQALIMGSGLRHRGMKYSVRNVRLFLAYLVGKSDGASFRSTYSVEASKKGRGRGKRKGKGKGRR